jgi:hypothetical protein
LYRAFLRCRPQPNPFAAGLSQMVSNFDQTE